ncbi:MAG: hypothetical protein IMX00_08640 [Limnochordales bacterium]|nr:hypothetical protein [Limnochordales bacterium]
MPAVFLGLDIGSATVKVAGIDEEARLLGTPVYLRHDQFSSQVEALKFALRQYLDSLGQPVKVAGVGSTGSDRELTRSLLGADLSRTEIFAHAVGALHLTGGAVRSIIEIGGQDAKVIIFDDQGVPQYFNMNTICSAGTGEFLKQLADEAGITLDEFGKIALQSTQPALIDATCTVFSRRDFRHLTQKGVPLADRLMGVCHALVRNYLVNVVRDAPLRPPVYFQGGVAFNPAVRQAFASSLGMPLLVTPHNDVVGALGMALIVREEALDEPGFASRFREDFFGKRFSSRLRYCHGCQNACELAQEYEERDGQIVVLDTLGGRCEGSLNPRNVKEFPQNLRQLRVPVDRRHRSGENARPRIDLINPSGKQVRDAGGRYFAGIDGGSRGTKYALLRGLGGHRVEIVAAGAVETGGDVILACRKAVRQLQEALPAGAQLSALGITGSAGDIIRDICVAPPADGSAPGGWVGADEGADVRSTEILAHYAWASYWVPDVGTVMDIGGNDTKLILAEAGKLDFAMNDKCAAGTGAFLEAVARRFHVPIEEFGRVALQSTNPARIAGRCAVFGESDVIHKARSGFATPDLFLGVAFAVCRTYLSDVARGRPLPLPIVAQGGGFLNEALRYAFRQLLAVEEDEFLVADDPRQVLCAGALGAALLALGRWEQGYESRFKGFERVLGSEQRTVSVVCAAPGCGRRCQGLVVLLENGLPIAGYRSIDCERGYFSGPITDSEQREYVWRLVSGRELPGS